LFVSCGVFFFIFGTFMVLGPEVFVLLPLTAGQDSRSCVSSLSVLSSASGVGVVLVVAAWDVWIV
jgi:hypothetical protein